MVIYIPDRTLFFTCREAKENQTIQGTTIISLSRESLFTFWHISSSFFSVSIIRVYFNVTDLFRGSVFCAFNSSSIFLSC